MAQRRKLRLWTSKSPCSVWLPFVIHWWTGFSVHAAALERLQQAVQRDFLAVKDHLIEIIEPQLIEILCDNFVTAQREHIVLMKNSSARDREPDITSPSLSCRCLLPSPACCCQHTHYTWMSQERLWNWPRSANWFYRADQTCWWSINQVCLICTPGCYSPS